MQAPTRTFRAADDLWNEVVETAKAENVRPSDVVRRATAAYVVARFQMQRDREAADAVAVRAA